MTSSCAFACSAVPWCRQPFFLAVRPRLGLCPGHLATTLEVPEFMYHTSGCFEHSLQMLHTYLKGKMMRVRAHTPDDHPLDLVRLKLGARHSTLISYMGAGAHPLAIISAFPDARNRAAALDLAPWQVSAVSSGCLTPSHLCRLRSPNRCFCGVKSRSAPWLVVGETDLRLRKLADCSQHICSTLPLAVEREPGSVLVVPILYPEGCGT